MSRSEYEYDVFLSHASVDKEDVARPLYEALSAAGLRVWLDEVDLALGDSLLRGIDRGLLRSRVAVMVLSPTFFEREWTQNELAAAMAVEMTTGTKRILPIWHGVDEHYLAERSPILAARLAASTTEGVPALLGKVQDAIARLQPPGQSAPTALPPTTRERIEVREETCGELLHFIEQSTAHLLGDPELRNQFAHLLGELALNAFRHGHASRATVTVGGHSVVLSESGLVFNPFTATTRSGGLGLRVLADFTRRAGDIVRYGYQPRPTEAGMNYTVFRFPAGGSDLPGQPCVVTATLEGLHTAAMSGYFIPTGIDFPADCSEYLFDARNAFASISVIADVTGAVLDALPLGAHLTVLVNRDWLGEMLTEHWKEDVRVGIEFR